MASISEDENVPAEENGTRRTRSGRKTITPPLPVTPSRSTRRTRRTPVEQDEPEPKIPDATDEEQQPAPPPPSSIGEDGDDDQHIDSSASSFPDLSAVATAHAEENTATSVRSTSSAAADSIDNLLANLAEDNANSLPSGGGGDNQLNEADDAASFTSIGSHGGATGRPSDADDQLQHDSSASTGAIADDLANGGDASASAAAINDSQATLADAEMVSEDELTFAPPPPLPLRAQAAASVAVPVTVDDAEEVSDEELPGPRLAELPADTEVVSEDELPSSNKIKRKADEDYDPCSPTESSEATASTAGVTAAAAQHAASAAAGGIPEKRAKMATDGVAVSGATKESEKLEEKKTLPELEKYWKTVRDDPADFTGWTYLLQYVDQENDIEAARAAYDAFLKHYPYCYGYWRKYADYEKRKGNKDKCEEVFQRGLQAIPLSVDLWIHYLTYVKQQHGVDNETPIRAQFEKAIEQCGLEFRSDKLWEAYIKWETEAKRVARIVSVYDRLLATPTQGYNGHFDSFQEIINNNPVTTLVSVDEFKRIRTEVRESSGTTVDTAVSAKTTADASESDAQETGDAEAAAAAAAAQPASSAEAEADSAEADDHVRSDDEATAIKDRILATRRKVHKLTVQAVTARWTFEEGIKRPYFHVKPLERCQLKNWKDYLDFEIEQGDRRRVLVLFERCLIACALYDDFWLKLVRYLEAQQAAAEARSDRSDAAAMTAAIREVFERACLVHHPDKPALHMLWASFEECHENADRSAQVLTDLDASSPNILQIAYRRINLERRRGNLDRAAALYDEYGAAARAATAETGKAKGNAASLAIKQARFLHRVCDDWPKAQRVLHAALAADPLNTRLVLQAVDLGVQRPGGVDEDGVVAVLDAFLQADGVELEQRVLFQQRKVEFLEDFGASAVRLQEAQRKLQSVMSKANEAKKKSELLHIKKSNAKDAGAQSSALSSSSAGQYGSAAAYAASGGYGAAVVGGSAASGGGYYGQQQQYASQQQQSSYGDGYNYNQQQWQQYSSGGSGGGGGGNGSGGSGGYSQWSTYGSSGYY